MSENMKAFIDRYRELIVSCMLTECPYRDITEDEMEEYIINDQTFYTMAQEEGAMDY